MQRTNLPNATEYYDEPYQSEEKRRRKFKKQLADKPQFMEASMPQGRPQDYSPDELQYGVSEFARVFGREPATDKEMEYVSRIIAGADAEQLAADMGDPNEAGPAAKGFIDNYNAPDPQVDRYSRPMDGAGDPNIGRADQSHVNPNQRGYYNNQTDIVPDYATGNYGPDISNDPQYQRAYDAFVQKHGQEPGGDGDYAEIMDMMTQQAPGKPKLRMTGPEDNYPNTNQFDYSGDINAEPRVDQHLSGSPQALIQQMQYQGEPDPARMAGAAGGPGGVNQAQALMEMMMGTPPDPRQQAMQQMDRESGLPGTNFNRRMGPGSIQPGPGSSLPGDQIFDSVGMDQRSRMGGRDPRAATGGIPPETIQRLLEAVMGGMKGR